MAGVISILIAMCVFFTSAVFAKPFGATECESSADFSCYKVKKGDSWQSLFPDEAERDAVMRINRTNMRLYSGEMLAVPLDHQANYMQFSPFAQNIDPPGTKLILVSLPDLAFGAYDESGSLVHWGPVSGGRGYCPDIGRGCHTPSGNYRIYTKGGSGCVSTKFPVGRGGAPMPYCMFFHGGFALHGSPKVPGYNDSHGCVRLFTIDAKWLNQEFTYGDDDVRVIIER